MTCPGSFGLSLHLPDPPESDYAAEGTRLHELAAGLLSGLPVEVVNSGDIDAVAPYVAHCQGLMSTSEWHEVETRLNHSAVLFGTADFLAQVGDTLYVVDLKTGQGVMVRPEQNAQLMLYAHMALSRYAASSAPLPKHVTLTIVQPPDTAEPVKSWTVDVPTVMAFGHTAELAIDEILGGKSDLVPGEHCRWCKAKPVCPKLRGAVASLPAGLQPAELDPLATAEVLDKADLVLQFIDAVRARGHDLISRGVPVPGWTLKPKRATRQWADEDKVMEIARRRKIKIWQDKLMSPAMAEKAHKEKFPAELAEQIVSVSSGTNLVKGDSAPRAVLPPDAPPMARLMANFETLKYRK